MHLHDPAPPTPRINRRLGHHEVESKEKHGVWGPMPESTITSPYVHTLVDFNTFTMGNPMPESTLTLESTLSPSHGLWIWPLVFAICHVQIHLQEKK